MAWARFPVFAGSPPGDAQRLFIAQLEGQISILNLENGQVLETPFVEIEAAHQLLGLAFHPDYAHNGYFYVDYVQEDGTNIVARYKVSDHNPNIADPSSARELLRIERNPDQHAGGWMDFGPDGYLYISTGDGGQGDRDNNAQNLRVLLGKILRIDVDGGDPYAIPPDNPFISDPDARHEIWALGLANPWRCSFDRLTGDLYIGDVGYRTREEINFQPVASEGGENYGWRCMEGTSCFNNKTEGCRCFSKELTNPIYEYGRKCVIGGFVYRGQAIPDLNGTYLFADFDNSNGRIFSFRYDGNQLTELTDRTSELQPRDGALRSPCSFGQDATGEIYVCSFWEQAVYKIISNATPLCEAVRKFNAKCNRDGQLTATVKLNSTDYDGYSMAISAGEAVFNVQVKGRAARLIAPGYEGPQSVCLLAPPDCKPPKDVDCPE